MRIKHELTDEVIRMIKRIIHNELYSSKFRDYILSLIINALNNEEFILMMNKSLKQKGVVNSGFQKKYNGYRVVG